MRVCHVHIYVYMHTHTHTQYCADMHVCALCLCSTHIHTYPHSIVYDNFPGVVLNIYYRKSLKRILFRKCANRLHSSYPSFFFLIVTGRSYFSLQLIRQLHIGSYFLQRKLLFTGHFAASNVYTLSGNSIGTGAYSSVLFGKKKKVLSRGKLLFRKEIIDCRALCGVKIFFHLIFFSSKKSSRLGQNPV